MSGDQKLLRAAAAGSRSKVESRLKRAGSTRHTRRRALTSARDSAGRNAMQLACEARAGGAGKKGWLGVVAALLRALDEGEEAKGDGEVADDEDVGLPTAEWLNSSTARDAPCLRLVVAGGGSGDAASEAQQLAAVAALLLHGADAAAVDPFLKCTARDEHIDRGNNSLPVAELLKLAEGEGGANAVISLLADRPKSLTTAAGWDVMAELPAVKAAVRKASVLRSIKGHRNAAPTPPHERSDDVGVKDAVEPSNAPRAGETTSSSAPPRETPSEEALADAAGPMPVDDGAEEQKDGISDPEELERRSTARPATVVPRASPRPAPVVRQDEAGVASKEGTATTALVIGVGIALAVLVGVAAWRRARHR